MAEHVIIDTDPGIDDALALLLALRSRELQVDAITTVCGNVSVDLATKYVFRVLALLPSLPPPPVASGAEKPLEKDLISASRIHGDDGLGGLDRYRDNAGNPLYAQPSVKLTGRTAADEILHQLATTSEPVSIIALGPLTNIATAIKKNTQIMATAKRIVFMGGAWSVSGNITPAAEFNMYVDPRAAGIVFNADIPLTMVGLDVTHQVMLTRESIAQATAASQATIGRFLIDATENLLNFAQNRYEQSVMYLHDPLAVGVVIDSSLVATESMHIEVETEGAITAGMTVADRRLIRPQFKKSSNTEVCISVDVPRFLALFWERLLNT